MLQSDAAEMCRSSKALPAACIAFRSKPFADGLSVLLCRVLHLRIAA